MRRQVPIIVDVAKKKNSVTIFGQRRGIESDESMIVAINDPIVWRMQKYDNETASHLERRVQPQVKAMNTRKGGFGTESMIAVGLVTGCRVVLEC